MRKAILSTLLLVLVAQCLQAQSKIFKEVGDEISSEVRTIFQGKAVVGYLVFTRIEQVNEDSFNYRIKIMDENLNDIGMVNFREVGLKLQAVSFEQDVLCLGYLKSNVLDYTFVGQKIEEIRSSNHTYVLTQFIGLDGKIKHTKSIPVSIDINFINGSNKQKVSGDLSNDIQLKSIEGTGFACFYGDSSSNLIVFNFAGDILWRKKVTPDSSDVHKHNLLGGAYMHTSGKDIFLVARKNYSGGGLLLLGYSMADTTAELNYELTDDLSNRLNVMNFENDPITGRPYIATLVHGNNGYIGISAINIGNLDKKNITTLSTYWDTYWNNNKRDIANDAQLLNKHLKEANLSYMFKGFDGFTYLAATNSDLVPELIKQDDKGKLTIETHILGEKIKGNRFRNGFYHVSNPETKTDYLFADVPQMIIVYDVTHKKIVHSFLHKEASILTTVLPAKEGYIMISEYNKKEKSTKVSIEAL